MVALSREREKDDFARAVALSSPSFLWSSSHGLDGVDAARKTSETTPPVPVFSTGALRRGDSAGDGLGFVQSLSGRSGGDARAGFRPCAVSPVRCRSGAQDKIAVGGRRFRPFPIRGLVPLSAVHQAAFVAGLPERAARMPPVLRLPCRAEVRSRDEAAEVPVRKGVGDAPVSAVGRAQAAASLPRLRHDYPAASIIG